MTTTATRTPGKLRKPSHVLKGHAPARATKANSLNNKNNNLNKPVASTPALEKKLNHATSENEKLQKMADKLTSELKKLNSDYMLKELENDKIVQEAVLAKNQLTDEKNRTLILEKKAATQRAHQACEQTKLLQRIRSLMLSTKAKRIASTQTDGWSEKGIMDEAQTQTMEELTKEKAERMLRDSDLLLTAFITELEREKLNAQNDLKFSIVQMEQRMKDENLFQLRRAQEASEHRLEQVTQQHAEQLRTLQADYDVDRERLEARIEEMMREIDILHEANDTLSRKADEAQESLKEQATLLGKADAQAEITRTELTKLREFKKNYQRDAKQVSDMKNEAEKYRDINEIILKEFEKLEEERDGLVAELERSIRSLGGVNGNKSKSLNSKALRLRDLIKLNS